ncbi:MAG: hypothetical protein BroJett030_26070 [Alphaproteobacteria bacterium]|nr:MAG: hypothetical protein BroJett030_26070 [Alphaproteobacteria bacterium]
MPRRPKLSSDGAQPAASATPNANGSISAQPGDAARCFGIVCSCQLLRRDAGTTARCPPFTGGHNDARASRTAGDTRSRILLAAEAIFARNGVRAGSLDRIAERAGVTKRMLCHHVRSKDDLIAACLAEAGRATARRRQAWQEDARGSVAAWAHQVLHEIGAAAANPRWRGWGFLRAAIELAELPGLPARRLAAAYKRDLERRLADQLRAEGLPEPEDRARCPMLVRDGAAIRVIVHRDASHAAAALPLVGLVLDPRQPVRSAAASSAAAAADASPERAESPGIA